MSRISPLRWLVKHPGEDLAATSGLLDRLLEETPSDLEAVRLRLDPPQLVEI